MKEMNLFTKEERLALLAFREDLHRHPELSHREFRTAGKIKSFLETIPGVGILSFPMENGCVARLSGGKPGREAALRADTDAIEQTENTQHFVRSEHEGIMHACGHDLHTAALLGAAMILSKERETLPGTVDLIFQPAEETTDGAAEMIGAGLFDRIHPDVFFGVHNRPEAACGTVVVHEGPLMAAKTNYEIRISGHGGHGSMPQLNVDPIVCMAAMIQSLQTVISRNMDPLMGNVLSVNYVNGGSRDNLVVNEAVMTVTVRSLTEASMERAKERLTQIVHQTAAAYECGCTVRVTGEVPPVLNSKEMASLAKKAAIRAVGNENVIDTQPAMASDDFAVFMKRVPSFYYWIGSGRNGQRNPAWHQPDFCPEEETVFVAAAVLAEAIREYLMQKENQ